MSNMSERDSSDLEDQRMMQVCAVGLPAHGSLTHLTELRQGQGWVDRFMESKCLLVGLEEDGDMGRAQAFNKRTDINQRPSQLRLNVSLMRLAVHDNC